MGDLRTLLWSGLALFAVMSCEGTGLEVVDPEGDIGTADVDVQVPSDGIGDLADVAISPDGVDDAPPADGVPADGIAHDGGDALADSESPCPVQDGCFGDACLQHEDCLSGICAPHLGGKACSKTCDESCPPGWSCELVGGGGVDAATVCVSSMPNLCRPCASSGDCAAGAIEAACVAHGPAEGAFCGGACGENDPCPPDYSCVESETLGGGTSLQCVPTEGSCPCSDEAIAAGLATPCEHVSTWGTCTGLRVCTADGLAACDAALPAEDVCNGIDDDCDGEIDEDTCDDGNGCTANVCDPEAGCQHPSVDGAPCDDGDACTTADQCVGASCFGDGVDCVDGNPCTDDACDAVYGCLFTDNAAPCEDGDDCTLGDQCVQGACQPGFAIQCDDGNPCTQDICDAAVGCVHVATPLVCDDGNPCTTGDGCSDGLCKAIGLLSCDDSNLCTTDYCDPSAGCQHVPNSQPCSDGSLCTVGDVCKDGVCDPGGDLGCDDGNLCTDDVCNPLSGCLHLHNTAPCDDLDPCTLGDGCVGGVCVSSQPLVCEDGNPCTSDYCMPMAGCTNVVNAHPCDDGDVCTLGDACGGGVCMGGSSALACDDGNPCTDDLCDGDLGCVHVPNTNGCDDQNACTVGDACAGGICIGVGSLACDDENPCTLDTCLVAGGCSYEDVQVPCTDGDPCTVNDACIDAACVAGDPKGCDDGNPCTEDACDELGDCSHAPQDGPCDDGNGCTTGDQCAAGFCQAGGLFSCDDGDVCTTDICHPVDGCQHLYNTAPCSDENVCTTGDACAQGVCLSAGALVCEDGNPCTDDACHAEGGCQFVANAQPCDDGDPCTVDDVCLGGACTTVAFLPCDDANPCTTDSCDPKVGCVHVENGLACDDGDVCTTGDSCVEGGCVAGPSLACDDGNPCTNDSCDGNTGCLFTANAIACDDANVCTPIDVCLAGACVGSGSVDCDDGNVCTTDGCDTSSGCTHVANDAPCDDGDLCTTTDACQGGACQGSGSLVCTDGNDCTDDLCDPGAGCLYPDNGAGCDDGDACTSGDACSSGACTGQAVDCDDGDSCTDDSCDSASGCVNTGGLCPCGTDCWGEDGCQTAAGRCIRFTCRAGDAGGNFCQSCFGAGWGEISVDQWLNGGYCGDVIAKYRDSDGTATKCGSTAGCCQTSSACGGGDNAWHFMDGGQNKFLGPCLGCPGNTDCTYWNDAYNGDYTRITACEKL